MEARHYFVLVVLLTWIPVGSVIAAYSKRFVDALAGLVVLGTMKVNLQAIHFVSREWYRGTSVGLEVTWIDLLWPVVLLSDLWTQRGRPKSQAPLGRNALWLVFAWDVLSVLGSEPKLFGAFELLSVLRGTLLFITIARYVKSEREVRFMCWLLSLAAMLEGAAALYTRVFMGRERAFGTMPHPNSLSMYGLMLAPPLFAVAFSSEGKLLRNVALLASGAASLCVVLTISRSGLVALAVELAGVAVACGNLRITLRKVVVGTAMLVAVTLVTYKVAGSFVRRFESEGGFSREFESGDTTRRGIYWTLAGRIARDHPWGIGLNNWSFWVTNRYAIEYEQVFTPYIDTDHEPPLGRVQNVDSQHAAPAHGLIPLTLGELGWLGVALLLWLWTRWFKLTGSFLRRRTAQLHSRLGVGIFFTVVGVFSQCMTEWELRQTPLAFMFMILMGTAAAMYPIRPSVRAGV